MPHDSIRNAGSLAQETSKSRKRYRRRECPGASIGQYRRYPDFRASSRRRRVASARSESLVRIRSTPARSRMPAKLGFSPFTTVASRIPLWDIPASASTNEPNCDPRRIDCPLVTRLKSSRSSSEIRCRTEPASAAARACSTRRRWMRMPSSSSWALTS
jgi:hypothetical protein